MPGYSLTSLVIVLAAVAAAPVLSDLATRRLTVPTVVLEIALGIVLGPALGLVHSGSELEMLSSMGLATLLFLAGLEVDLANLRGAPLRRASLGWVMSLCLGVAIGFTLSPADGPRSGLIVGLALTTTALGALLPILRDSGQLDTVFGRHALAGAAVGELGPILAIALLLSGDRPVRTALPLLAFAAVVALATVFAGRARTQRVTRLIESTLTTSGQVEVRVVVLFLAFMVWIASELGVDVLLGAFAAGMVFRLFGAGASEREAEHVESKLQGLGFGFLVPVFFVMTGVHFDLGAITADPTLLFVAVGVLALFLIVRGVPTALLQHDLAPLDRLALGCYVSTELPLVVVITTIGTASGRLHSGVAAAMVTAAMLSVLALPLAAQRMHRLAVARDLHPRHRSSPALN